MHRCRPGVERPAGCARAAAAEGEAHAQRNADPLMTPARPLLPSPVLTRADVAARSAALAQSMGLPAAGGSCSCSDAAVATGSGELPATPPTFPCVARLPTP